MGNGRRGAIGAGVLLGEEDIDFVLDLELSYEKESRLVKRGSREERMRRERDGD